MDKDKKKTTRKKKWSSPGIDTVSIYETRAGAGGGTETSPFGLEHSP